MNSNIESETWYCWREYAVVDASDELPAESKPRLLVPWADPMKYEHPMDWLFESTEEATNIKEELAPEEDWVLCKMTIVPVCEQDCA